MLCENCKKVPATVHIANANTGETANLCVECDIALNGDKPRGIDLAKLIADLNHKNSD